MSRSQDRPADDEGAGRWSRILVWCIATITVILVGWVLHAASVAVTGVFGIFLALLVAPIDR